VAVVGSPAKVDFLQQRFQLPSSSIVLRDRQFARRLDDALGALGAHGFDVVFDAVYGEWFEALFSRLAPEGRYVLYGAADFMSGGRRPNLLRLAWQYLRRPRLDPLAMIPQNRALMAFNLIWLWEQADRLPDSMRATLSLIAARPHVGEVFAFDSAHAALGAIQSGRTTGKLILTPR
jgi:alcohol dehydrogenase